MSKKREYNLRLWKGLIQEQQASGMTITAWCKQNGYTKDKYYYWLEQVRNETFDTEVRNLPVPSEQERSAGTAFCSPAMMNLLWSASIRISEHIHDIPINSQKYPCL